MIKVKYLFLEFVVDLVYAQRDNLLEGKILV